MAECAALHVTDHQSAGEHDQQKPDRESGGPDGREQNDGEHESTGGRDTREQRGEFGQCPEADGAQPRPVVLGFPDNEGRGCVCDQTALLGREKGRMQHVQIPPAVKRKR